MTIDFSAIQKNTFILSIVTAFARKVVTIIATSLVTADVVQQAEATSFVTVSVPIVVGVTMVLLSTVWSFIEKYFAANKLAVAIQSPAQPINKQG